VPKGSYLESAVLQRKRGNRMRKTKSPVENSLHWITKAGKEKVKCAEGGEGMDAKLWIAVVTKLLGGGAEKTRTRGGY